MAILRYNNIGISAIAACVPQKIEFNKDLGYMMSEEEIHKAIHNIGIEERRIAEPDVCASDLCYRASQQLLNDNAIDPQSIDVLLFVSQTSDYHQPATAAILQHKLGLGKNTIAFDINLACSGYVYGLSTAYAYAQNEGVNRVLLLVGETMSKIVSRYDKVNTPLFGDAGTATLIEKGEKFGKAVFSLHTDGKGAEVMMIPDGGFRNPVTQSSFVEETDANGDKRTRLQFRMDGMAVFNFGMSEEPRDVKNIVEVAGLELEQIDLLIYHQANKFMTDFFTKWLKFDKTKTPYSIKKYGNTSSASIPLTIVSELYKAYPNRKNVILSGFGAGLSWGSVLLNLDKCQISKIVEY
ncbi:MAG: ketoacyl-ACP synthase III [Paludibacteraceae bacterium]|nr:ketoacyl-ACP synthase III [Paludibacteraceae bacterium]